MGRQTHQKWQCTPYEGANLLVELLILTGYSSSMWICNILFASSLPSSTSVMASLVKEEASSPFRKCRPLMMARHLLLKPDFGDRILVETPLSQPPKHNIKYNFLMGSWILWISITRWAQYLVELPWLLQPPHESCNKTYSNTLGYRYWVDVVMWTLPPTLGLRQRNSWRMWRPIRRGPSFELSPRIQLYVIVFDQDW